MREKKVWFKNSRGQKLCGMLASPEQETDSLVVISHGFAANKDRSRLIKLSRALASSGMAAFRFDFGGSGESEVRPISITGQVDDLKSAIQYVRRKYKNVGLLGESFGGLISLLAYDNGIKTIVLLAPITDAKAPTRFKGKNRDILMREGSTTFIKDDRKFKVEKQYVLERERINQKKILSKIKCPTLIIHGTKDNTVPIVHSKSAIRYLPKESKLEIIKNSDHVFRGYIDKIISISNGWFKEHLK